MLKHSQDNFEAAKLLFQTGNYDVCVVAYYYSVLQRMMYALNFSEKRPLPYDSQNLLDENPPFKLLLEITNRITVHKEDEAFDSLFRELFEVRKKADYSQESLTQDDCANCRTLYDSLIGRLDRFFPVKKVE